jgi:cyclopropane-fatty-acyl-phospholipid synthase
MMSAINDKYKKTVEEILGLAGVEINGSNPWDIRIHNDEFYRKVITEGELGMGESYMDNWWDAEKIDELIFKIAKARLKKKYD